MDTAEVTAQRRALVVLAVLVAACAGLAAAVFVLFGEPSAPAPPETQVARLATEPLTTERPSGAFRTATEDGQVVLTVTPVAGIEAGRGALGAGWVGEVVVYRRPPWSVPNPLTGGLATAGLVSSTHALRGTVELTVIEQPDAGGCGTARLELSGDVVAEVDGQQVPIGALSMLGDARVGCSDD